MGSDCISSWSLLIFLPCNSQKVRVVILGVLDFYRLSYLGYLEFMGATGLGCCITPCFLVILASGLERTLIC